MAVMYGYIYETTNLVNGKKYIGQHKSSEFDPNYKGSGKLLKQAFSKYGWDKFSVELLVPCFSQEELNEEEIMTISHFNAVESSRYYNIARGGDGGDVTGGNHLLHSERTKLGMQNMSSESRSRLIAAVSQPLSEEHKEALLAGSRNSWKNPARREKMRQLFLGNNYASRPRSQSAKDQASEFQKAYQNTDAAKLSIAEGRGLSMLNEFIRLNLPFSTPEDWDSNRGSINYGRKYKSSYFLKFFDDWNSFISILMERR